MLLIQDALFYMILCLFNDVLNELDYHILFISRYLFINQQKYHMQTQYDIVIIGAGCVGVAAAYYAAKKGIQNICVIEKGKIGSADRYWSSSFSARQNRVQYNEEYLTRFVLESNKEWKAIEAELNQQFLHDEGALWFGNKNTTTSEGNIKAANAVLSSINSSAQTNQSRVESLYMEKIMPNSPNFMKAFKPYNPDVNNPESEWDSWSALYQPDGGSVNMEASYTKFLNYATTNGVVIKDQTAVLKHVQVKGSEYKNVITIQTGTNAAVDIVAKKMFISVGVHTPYFLKNVMNTPSIANGADYGQFVVQEYVASYIKIEDNPQSKALYNSLPNYYNFLTPDGTQNQFYSGYGFRFHEWDNLPSVSGSKFVKFGTMACNNLTTQEQINNSTYTQVPIQDHRVQSALRFVRQRMNGLIADDPQNKHFPCPIAFYTSRETILDYLNRKEESVVVQSGGWIGKYYPLLAKTAIDMLFQFETVQNMRNDQSSVIGNFINRTRFPIKRYVDQKLLLQNSEGKTHFDTLIVGAGCSGLYTGLRLNEAKKKSAQMKDKIGKIGIFDLAERISGRLKSFHFEGVATPMELGGMRYIPTNHILVNKIITALGIPYIKFPMNGDPIQDHSRRAYLRNDYYHMDEWATNQKMDSNLHTSYRIEGPIMGMDAFQIISFSMFMILTAPQNVNLLTQAFLEKTDAEINDQKNRYAQEGTNIHFQSSWYRDWKNYVYQDKDNKKSFIVALNLRQWNQLKPVLLFRFRFPVTSKDLYVGQERADNNVYPLYKFGFQNVVEAQFGHQAYQFVAEQNGYFSNTSNASYLDQVMTYLLDFGNVSYRTLSDGFDQINYSMANILLDDERGFQDPDEGIYLSHKLVDILPSEVQGTKYTVVFHVPNVAQKANYRKTPLSHCKGTAKSNVRKLGVSEKITKNESYREIRFTANRIILGMPKRSITNLISEIQILRKPLQSYPTFYSEDRAKYQNIFTYPGLNQYLNNAGNVSDLTAAEKQRLLYLQLKQQQSFSDPSKNLSQLEKQQLESLSNRQFLKSLQPLSQHDQNFESQKSTIFEKDPAIKLNTLTLAANGTQTMPAMKIVMNFDRNWWDPNNRINSKYQKKYKNSNLVNSVEEMRGVSLTDLPTRQTLYFSEGADNLLLGSYNDMITTEFWQTLHNNFSQVWTPKQAFSRAFETKQLTPKIVYPENQDIEKAKKVLVKEILKQLSLIHQMEVKEQWLKECIYQFWGNDPYGGGYHNFYSGYYIPTLMRIMRKPWVDESIHFVGQAYSNETGWVEGTFQTCEKLLQDDIGVSELVPGYYAGY